MSESKIGHPLILSAFDTLGGAALASYRLLTGLQKAGQPATMWVSEKFSDNPAVRKIRQSPESYEIYEPKSPREAVLKTALSTMRTDRTNTQLSLPSFGIRVNEIPGIDDFSLMNLHWVANFISTAGFEAILQCGIPVVWSLHDLWGFTGGCHYPAGCENFLKDCAGCPQISGWMQKQVEFEFAERMRLAKTYRNLYVVNSTDATAAISRQSPLYRDRPEFQVPYGVEADRFRPHDRAEQKAKLGLDPTKLLFTFAASDVLEKRKGFGVLLEALRILPTLVPRELLQGVEFLCIGHRSKEFMTDSPLNLRSLPFFKSLEDLAVAYQASDFYLLPTLEDVLPNTLTESMSTGAIPIGFATGGIAEVISHEKNGWIAPEKTPAALAQSIAHAVQMDRAARNRFSEAARATILARHTQEQFARNYMDVYQEVLELHRERPLTRASRLAGFIRAWPWILKARSAQKELSSALEAAVGKETSL